MSITKSFRIAAFLLGVLLPVSSRAQQQPVDAEGHQWWQHAVFYEIYPRSFADSDNNGIGDLRGIDQHLDYLKNLGIDAVWITPCFPSPQVDFGYDVSDYDAIDPMYGTLVDFDKLVADGKKRNVRVILDFVVNHTSDKHKWFIDSKSPKTAVHRDSYIWRDGKGPDQPPNNWLSTFGSPAGPSTKKPISITTIIFILNSPTSTGAILPSKKPCSTSPASGTNAA